MNLQELLSLAQFLGFSKSTELARDIGQGIRQPEDVQRTVLDYIKSMPSESVPEGIQTKLSSAFPGVFSAVAKGASRKLASDVAKGASRKLASDVAKGASRKLASDVATSSIDNYIIETALGKLPLDKVIALTHSANPEIMKGLLPQLEKAVPVALGGAAKTGALGMFSKAMGGPIGIAAETLGILGPIIGNAISTNMMKKATKGYNNLALEALPANNRMRTAQIVKDVGEGVGKFSAIGNILRMHNLYENNPRISGLALSQLGRMTKP